MKLIKIYYGKVRTVKAGMIDVREADEKEFQSYHEACEFENYLIDKGINYVNANEYTGNLLVRGITNIDN